MIETVFNCAVYYYFKLYLQVKYCALHCYRLFNKFKCVCCPIPLFLLSFLTVLGPSVSPFSNLHFPFSQSFIFSFVVAVADLKINSGSTYIAPVPTGGVWLSKKLLLVWKELKKPKAFEHPFPRSFFCGPPKKSASVHTECPKSI